MRLEESLTLHAYGTSEGVEKAWDSRGRGRKVDASPHPDKGKFKAAPSNSKPGFFKAFHHPGNRTDAPGMKRSVTVSRQANGRLHITDEDERGNESTVAKFEKGDEKSAAAFMQNKYGVKDSIPERSPSNSGLGRSLGRNL